MLITGFKIKRKIADGGFASVYEGTRARDGLHVAIKVLSPQGVAEGHAGAFKNEAKLLMTLDHPHVIKVYELVAAERPAYCMEYFDSMSLKAAVVKYGDQIKDAALGVFLNVSRGIAYIHEQGIVHRDLKPENILVSTEGDVRLIDFSIAYRDTLTGRLFRSRKVQGTPAYMAPEQILSKKIDAKADVYALGCVFYEVLAGRPLFVTKTQTQLLQAHVKTKPKPLARLDKEVPWRLSELINRMVHKVPEGRPDMATVMAEIETLAHEEG